MMRDGQLTKLWVVYDVDGYKPLSAAFYILFMNNAWNTQQMGQNKVPSLSKGKQILSR